VRAITHRAVRRTMRAEIDATSGLLEAQLPEQAQALESTRTEIDLPPPILCQSQNVSSSCKTQNSSTSSSRRWSSTLYSVRRHLCVSATYRRTTCAALCSCPVMISAVCVCAGALETHALEATQTKGDEQRDTSCHEC